MFKMICISILISIPSIAGNIKIGTNIFEYKLDKSWKLFQGDSAEGVKKYWYKRTGIIDNKGIRVIPNLIIHVFNITPTEADTVVNDSLLLEFMFRGVLLENNQLEALSKYDSKKGKNLKYEISHELSSGFVINYIDDFGDTHDLYYFVMMQPNRIGAFIMIDCTQEIFVKIDNEVRLFFKSLTFK